MHVEHHVHTQATGVLGTEMMRSRLRNVIQIPSQAVKRGKGQGTNALFSRRPCRDLWVYLQSCLDNEMKMKM